MDSHGGRRLLIEQGVGHSSHQVGATPSFLLLISSSKVSSLHQYHKLGTKASRVFMGDISDSGYSNQLIPKNTNMQ